MVLAKLESQGCFQFCQTCSLLNPFKSGWNAIHTVISKTSAPGMAN